ncbi:MAG: hypothetical protein ACI4AA_00165 [Lachnospiraceae bacterium]
MGKNYLLSKIRVFEQNKSMEGQITAEYLCPDGKAQIELYLNGETYFNPLTKGKQQELSSEIYDLIDKKLYTIPLKYPIRLCFCGEIPTEQTQEEIRSTLQKHYMYVLHDKKEDLRINMFKAVGLGLFGVFLLAIYFALELILTNPVFMEFLSIAGCFSVWEAVDSWLIQRKILRAHYLYAGQAALCEVVFSEVLQ